MTHPHKLHRYVSWWETLGSLFAIFASIAVGFIAFTAVFTIFPEWGLVAALIFGASGMLTECMVFWNFVRWSFRMFFVDGRFSELAASFTERNKHKPLIRKTSSAESKWKDYVQDARDVVPASEKKWKHFFIDLMFAMSVIIGFGFAAMTFTHTLIALTAFGLAAPLASSIALGLAACSAIAGTMFFFRILHEWVIDNIFRKIWRNFKDEFSPGETGVTGKYIIKTIIKSLALVAIIALNIFTVATMSDTWFHAGRHFMNFLNLSAMADIFCYVVIGIFILPINIIAGIEYGVKSIGDIVTLFTPSAKVDDRPWLKRLGSGLVTMLALMILGLHVFSEGAVSGEEIGSRFYRIITTIIGAVSELLFDLHFVIELLKGKDEGHHGCKHDHGTMVSSMTKCLSILMPCCFDAKADDEADDALLHGHAHDSSLGTHKSTVFGHGRQVFELRPLQNTAESNHQKSLAARA